MTPTHHEVTAAMFAASVALGELLEGVTTAGDAQRLGLLAEACRLATARLAAIEAATNHKGMKH